MELNQVSQITTGIYDLFFLPTHNFTLMTLMMNRIVKTLYIFDSHILFYTENNFKLSF